MVCVCVPWFGLDVGVVEPLLCFVLDALWSVVLVSTGVSGMTQI